MCVSAADDQGEQGKLQIAIAVLALFEQHSVNVSFEMVDGDERLVSGESEGLGVAQADQQSARESRALCDGDCVDGFVGLAGIFESLANHRHDGAEMLARSELGDNSSEGLMGGDLRVNDVGDEFFARAHDGGGGFVAGRLDAEDVGVWHGFIVRGSDCSEALASNTLRRRRLKDIDGVRVHRCISNIRV